MFNLKPLLTPHSSFCVYRSESRNLLIFVTVLLAIRIDFCFFPSFFSFFLFPTVYTNKMRSEECGPVVGFFWVFCIILFFFPGKKKKSNFDFFLCLTEIHSSLLTPHFVCIDWSAAEDGITFRKATNDTNECNRM